jgi:hypothetical protein
MNFVIARHFDFGNTADQQAEVSVEQRFFERLERAAPELRSLRSEHEADNGELLGHLLIADILRWACAVLDSQPGAVDAVLEEMARSLQPGDDPVSNMISVSFLEHLGADDPRELAIRARLPRRLREELERIESWRPDSVELPPDEEE